jgi:hypothetical protein
MLHKDYDCKGSVAKNSLVVNLKGLGAMTNWLAVNRQSWSNSDSEWVVVEQSLVGKNLSTESEDIDGICDQATTGEDTADWEDLYVL